jgi:hypothetical protein
VDSSLSISGRIGVQNICLCRFQMLQHLCLSAFFHTVNVGKSSSLLLLWMDWRNRRHSSWICSHQYSSADNPIFPFIQTTVICRLCTAKALYSGISRIKNVGLSWYCYDCILCLGTLKQKIPYLLWVVILHCCRFFLCRVNWDQHVKNELVFE